jgi:hypothetical protein
MVADFMRKSPVGKSSLESPPSVPICNLLQEEEQHMQDNTTTADSMSHPYGARRCGGISRRPWSWAEIAIVVGGFIVFWPVGLVALGLKLYKGELWKGSSDITPPWKDKSARDVAGKWQHHWQGRWHQPSTGNAAFDDYRKAQLERLEEERRKLEEQQRAFGEYLAKLRRAKDQEEFDRFMAEQNTSPAAG